ncbi:M20/M25/M40 family metallo-hydrolase [Microtetraspora niveoalba]|uniref:M20/M25/M40 family metallo-hydrolase n=1 Tax=Microtetraspora niveoalba TaxID=46175 RepID=UPI00082F8D89|nr:M20/M25/M40 family metallo-hydrolase [Microtetraspora niveoalba]
MTTDPLERLRIAAYGAIDGDRIVEAVRLLAAGPSPRGAERATAARLLEWARPLWPTISWRRDEIGAAGANLVATSHIPARHPLDQLDQHDQHGQDGRASGASGRRDAHARRLSAADAGELLLYSHLDTSLPGDPERDRWATGIATPPAPLTVDREAGTLAGFGLGVARGPAAAALAGYTAAVTALRDAGLPHRVTLLLAGGGTHASPFAATPESDAPVGVEEHLRAGPRPRAAVVAKCGPPGILHEEPGAAFVRVRLGTAYRPVLARDAAPPAGGLIAHLGEVFGLLERWRERHVAARAGTGGQIAAEAGIGAVRGGMAAKPDLLPGVVELHLYLVTVPGDDVAGIADDIRTALETGLRGGPLEDCALSVEAREAHPAGVTPPDAAVVRHAAAAWTREHGAAPPPVTGWKGSTDGVVLRGHGVPTVRVGPAVRADPADPRRDVLDLDTLLRFARIYSVIVLRHALYGESAIEASHS